MKVISLASSLVAARGFESQSIIAQFLAGIPNGPPLEDGASPHGPSVAPQFTATMVLNYSDPTMPIGAANGSIVYDATEQKSWMQTIAPLPKFGSDAIINQTAFTSGSTTMYSVMDGQCYNYSGPFARGGFASFFGWLSLANKTGQDTVEGKTCDKYTYVPPPPNDKYGALVACLHGDEPLYFHQMTQTMYFNDFQRSVDKTKLRMPALCQEKAKTCGSNKIIKKTIYVAHPEDNYNISGQDVADAKGDAVFLCTDKMMWKIGNYKLLSAFDLSIVDAYSQYTNYPPPGTHGFGGDGYHVGRETPIGIGRHGGQCDDDADWFERVGIWYSLSRGGQCLTEKHQLGVNCTWRIERRVNTVEMDCLFHKQGMLSKCDKAEAPFEDVTQILLKSLASEDVAKGGCPSIKAPMCKAHPACAHLSGDCCPHQDGTMLDCCNASSTSVDSIIV